MFKPLQRVMNVNNLPVFDSVHTSVSTGGPSLSHATVALLITTSTSMDVVMIGDTVC
jgi:hypothetical protein